MLSGLARNPEVTNINHFSRVDGSKNAMSLDGEVGKLFIMASNAVNAYYTASIEDFDKIAPFRWRIFDKDIVTTMPNGDGYEHAVKVQHYLLGKESSEKIIHVDKNPYNCSRGNIVTAYNSTVTVHGKYATLHCPNGVDVKFDSEFVPMIDRYSWFATQQRQLMVIRANIGSREKISFHRLIMGLVDAPRTTKIKHKNGDYLDCRKSNMQVYSGRG